MTQLDKWVDLLIEQARGIGVRVTDDIDLDAGRAVVFASTSWLYTDAVHIRVWRSPITHRQQVIALSFSRYDFPKKAYGRVSLTQARFRIESLKDYTAHTHCRLGYHDQTCPSHPAAAVVASEGATGAGCGGGTV